MRVFSHLHIEQDGVIELLSQYDEDMSERSKTEFAVEICRVADSISQARDEIVIPRLVLAGVDHRLLDDAVIEMDLARLVVGELSAATPAEFLYDGLVRVLNVLLARRFSQEEGPDGLWAAASRSALDFTAIDIAIGQRLRELDAACRSDDWTPAPPAGFETCRSAVPLGALAWRNEG
ncbi:MAG: Hemerythrin [Brevundimonas sp.]|nr:Hemerythrin [Brevundimonas sp.]